MTTSQQKAAEQIEYAQHPLTEGTTPGPWKVLAGHPGEVGTADNRHWIAGTYDQEGQYSEEDLARAQADTRLIAAVPELAAENHRIITALVAWRADIQGDLNAEGVNTITNLDEDPNAWSMQEYGELRQSILTRDQITLILNGETNE